MTGFPLGSCGRAAQSWCDVGEGLHLKCPLLLKEYRRWDFTPKVTALKPRTVNPAMEGSADILTIKSKSAQINASRAGTEPSAADNCYAWFNPHRKHMVRPRDALIETTAKAP